ncbi:hypothetical protein LTR62_004782 [Meristemomyces frigidus]|uniref:PAS domain-containing protein n=1 Tax=Meristemomyces frigidus TaxID=1508187 RepID=A0AAN7TG14_9PEZI|nr:hypothetical protein LTR62_004782 [Meristemomyces frigidus]
METTFISIHDLTPDARILYSSDSVVDILGYTPDEIVNRPAWDFFHADELPYAQKFHEQRVRMDKAAVLAYCKVRDRDGRWIGCECCFTIVYDVMIVCTSIYKQGLASEKRALDAPLVRRMFSSSPRDPRYHMLSHISARFKQDHKALEHEPRAALFLNRFTRTLTIMYATSGLEEVIGVPAEAMRGRSFYYCIAENCLQDAVKCLENAKGNDSIAYLRFWFRDPRIDDHQAPPDDDSDDEMTGTEFSVASSVDGGVQLQGQETISPESAGSSNALRSTTSMEVEPQVETEANSRTSSGDSAVAGDSHEAIFGTSLRAEESMSSRESSPGRERREQSQALHVDPVELEAVVSCASDGLVVCLRRARPMVPHPTQRPGRPVYENGLFAAPWAQEPMLPPVDQRGHGGFGPAFAPALGPHGARPQSASPIRAASRDQHDFMASIRDQAVFAWALTGINGTLANSAIGKASGEAVPPEGFPIWTSEAQAIFGYESERSPINGWTNGHDRPRAQLFGDPGLGRNGGKSTSSASPGQHMTNENGHGSLPGGIS